MAARRLIFILIGLLVVSTIAAWLVAPTDPIDNSDSSNSVETLSPVTDTVPEGELLKATIDADTAAIEVVCVRLGDQIQLSARSSTADSIVIPGLGLREPVSADAAAMFDIFADEQGRFTVRAEAGGDAGHAVGRLEVHDHCPKAKASGSATTLPPKNG